MAYKITPKLKWKSGTFPGQCNKCPEKVSYRLFDQWGDTRVVLKSLCKKHWKERLQEKKKKSLPVKKVKSKSTKKSKYGNKK